MFYYLKQLIRILRDIIKERVPEKPLLTATYLSNIIVVVLQILRLYSEENIIVKVLELATIGQLLIPVILLDIVPLFNYLFLFSISFVAMFFNLVELYPLYYTGYIIVGLINVLRIDPVIFYSRRLRKITVSVVKVVTTVSPPKTKIEILSTLKFAVVYAITLLVSAILYFVYGERLAVITLVYSLIIVSSIVLGIGASPYVEKTKKISMSVYLVFRYKPLLNLVLRMKEKLLDKFEKIGENIYEVEFLSRYIVLFFSYILLLPSLLLLLYIFLPLSYFIISLPIAVLLVLLIYNLPSIILSMKINSRKTAVEKELPFFLIYLTTLISSGYSFSSAMKILAKEGSELFPRFVKEAKYFISLLEHGGKRKRIVGEQQALEYYATTHPSDEYRNLLLGLLHQLQLGTAVFQYFEQKLTEQLDALKRKLEQYANRIEILSDVLLMVIIIPTLPVVLAFLMNPESVYSILFTFMIVVNPALATLMALISSSMRIFSGDKYTLRYTYSLIGGLIGLIVSTLLVHVDVIIGIGIILLGISLGIYIEFYKQYKEFNTIEKYLPILFRDLAELREETPSMSTAIKSLSNMNYPENIRRMLRKMYSLREQNIKFSQQPFLSRSFFWKLFQFLIGKIEDSGGGTSRLFHQLMIFFSEYNNIKTGLLSALRLHEIIIYVAPIILLFATSVTLTLFSSISQAFSLENVTAITPEVFSNYPAIMNILRGVSPFSILISRALVLETSFLLGLTAGKVVYGTVKNTRILSIVLLITIISLILIPEMTSLLTSTYLRTH